MKNTYQRIVESMNERPEDWESDLYQLRNKKMGLSIWTGNGFLFYGPSDCLPEKNNGFIEGFSLWQKFKFGSELRNLKRKRMNIEFTKQLKLLK